ncbi:MAG TPA: hypothetical protein VHE99_06195 [Gammaproteobacteria bacterium]|nr:hypothetical protein [Gammaproteobacteria bacterium]
MITTDEIKFTFNQPEDVEIGIDHFSTSPAPAPPAWPIFKPPNNSFNKEELLFRACLKGNLEEVRLLLKHGANAKLKLDVEAAYLSLMPRAHPIVTPLMGVVKSQASIEDKKAIIDELIAYGANINYISELNPNSSLPFQRSETVLDRVGKHSVLGQYLIKNYNAKTKEELVKTFSWIEMIWQEKYRKTKKWSEERAQKQVSSSDSHSVTFSTFSDIDDSKHRKIPNTINGRLAAKQASSIVDKIQNILDLRLDVIVEILIRADALEEIDQLDRNPRKLVAFCGNMDRFRPILKQAVIAEILNSQDEATFNKCTFFRHTLIRPSEIKKPSALKSTPFELEASNGINHQRS